MEPNALKSLMSEASSLEAGLYVPGNRPEFPFPLQVVSTEQFSPVVVAFPAKVQLVRKTYHHNSEVTLLLSPDGQLGDSPATLPREFAVGN